MELVKLETIKNALPESQLRHSGSWLFSPQPLALDKKTTKALTQLGHPLAQFQRPPTQSTSAVPKVSSHWIHHLLDAGKPDWMIELQQSQALRETMPSVIRPDLILTAKDGDENATASRSPSSTLCPAAWALPYGSPDSTPNMDLIF